MTGGKALRAWRRKHATDLVIVTGIVIDRAGGAPTASGGTVEVAQLRNPDKSIGLTRRRAISRVREAISNA